MATPSEPIAIPTTGLPVFEASPEERALQKCYTDLCDNLDAKAVLPHLYEECAISKRTYRDLRAKLGCDPSGAVEDFLLSLNSRAVRALCAVLLQTEETRDLGVRLQGELLQCGCAPSDIQLQRQTGLSRSLPRGSRCCHGSPGSGTSPTQQATDEKERLVRCLSFPDNISTVNGHRASWPSSCSPPSGHTVKVTNMPKHLTKKELSGMLKEAGAGQVLRINVVEADVAKPNHAFVVCPSREAANCVVRCLHEKAMGQLSLTAQLHNGTVQQKRPFSVKVSNLAPTVNEERLQDLLGEYSGEVTVCLRQSSSDDSSEINYAWLNCPSCDVADAVVEKVNGKELDDMQVKAVKKPEPKVPLKISNLPKHINEVRLKSALVPIDPSADVKIVQVEQQKANFGYINCASPVKADKVFENLNGLDLHGLTLKVRFKPKSDETKRSLSASMESVGPTLSLTLKLSHLPPTLTESSLHRLGSEFFGFKSATLIPSTPTSHGYMQFESKEQAQHAVTEMGTLGYCVKLL